MRIAVLWLACLVLVALAVFRLSFAQGSVQFPRMLSGKRLRVPLGRHRP
jgi:hypothetical protein